MTEQLNQLIIEDNKEETHYQIGDQVDILNNYCRLQGVQGLITKVTSWQVLIKIKGYQHSKTNHLRAIRNIIASKQKEEHTICLQQKQQ